jgi:hypothetical protein
VNFRIIVRMVTKRAFKIISEDEETFECGITMFIPKFSKLSDFCYQIETLSTSLEF